VAADFEALHDSLGIALPRNTLFPSEFVHTRTLRVKKPTRKLMRAAYHEAGHAVIAVCLRASLTTVSIIPDETSLGRANHEFSPWIKRMLQGEPIPPRLLEREIQVSLAGCESEARFTGRHAYRSADGDFNACINLASLIYVSAKIVEKYLALQKEIVREMIKAPRVWVQIEAVAEKLLEFRELNGKKVRQICKDAIESRRARLAELEEQRRKEDRLEQDKAWKRV
jgi:ATP-dependent Zn protease